MGGVLLCALASEPGEHGDGMYYSDWGTICLNCFRARQNRGLEGPDTEPTKAGVISDKAYQARGSDDSPLEGGAHWSWLPYDMPIGVDEDGRTVYGQHQNPIHCKKARSGAAGRGRSIPRNVRVQVELEQLAGEHLTPDQWAVLYLQLQGHSYAAIAEQLGIAEVTVRERLRRARAKLREVQAA